MPFEPMWQSYQKEGFSAASQTMPPTALETLYLAILAFSEQRYNEAADLARQAANLAPADLLYKEAATYLDRVANEGKQNVYVSGEGFAAFIRGGGNIPLYEQTSAALRRVYEEYDSLSLLDVGVGDGLALLPALTSNVRQLHLLEPSAAMLEKTVAALKARGVPAEATCATLQEFAASHTGQWEVIEATYSLQSLSPSERPGILKWLHEYGRRLLIAEFDAPPVSEIGSPAQVAYILARFQHGLAEYAGDGGLVAQGFLLPVMFGNFDRTAARTNYEQPLAQWVADLKTAGFQTVETRLLYPYWWADAYLIEARV
ncbi:MAG: class I SAM-dependent methyltransferase [Anaerolineae bacterium]|nr:class I SAM-dependent methyltransferase [Anaerolineae bacterium]